FSGRGSPARHRYPISLLRLRGSRPRAAGWSAATLCFGPTRTTSALQQVVGNLGYSGRDAGLNLPRPLVSITPIPGRKSHDGRTAFLSAPLDNVEGVHDPDTPTKQDSPT